MSRTMLRVLALCFTVLLVAGACGDDGENGAGNDAANQQAEEQEPAGGEFCDKLVTLQATVIAASSGGPTEEIPSLVQEAQEIVPDELADQMELIASTIAEASENQDEGAFESEEFTSADEEVDQYVADNCGYEKIDVRAVDYAFEGVPPTLPAGNVTISWENSGEEVHEMVLLRLKDETLSVDDLMKMSDKEAESKVQFVNGAFGPPGTTDVESIPMEAGKYIAVCFLPVGSTSLEALESAEGPPHIAKGMVAEFTVE